MSIEKPMEASSEEFEIEVVDTTPEEDRDRTPLPPETEAEIEARSKEMDDYSSRVQKRFGELTHRYNDERRAKEEALRKAEEAEEFAQKAFERAKQLEETLNNGYGMYMNEFNARLNAAQELAEQTYRQAVESGDTTKQLEAQRAFSEIAVQRARAQSMPPLAQSAENVDKPLTQKQESDYSPQNQAPTPKETAQSDVVDPATEEWHIRNPWFGKDKEMTSLALGVHGQLVDEGIQVSTPEYFSALDERVRTRFPEKFGKPRKSSPVAPATRTVSAAKKVTLTTTEVERAKKLGVPLELYAREKAKIMGAN